MSSKNSETPLKDRIDWITVIVPFLAILALCVCFIMMPDASKSVLDTIRFILGDTFGLFYLAVGLFVFLLSLFLAFSRFGNIRLGKPDEKPKYPLFVWASMMFTSGLAADILFYSFCEWILYANDPHISEMGSMQTWSSTYPLFHWGPIPWAFYLVLAVCFGFMLHVRGCHKQKYSEACRALLGNKVDGLPGKLIDLLALFVHLGGQQHLRLNLQQGRRHHQKFAHDVQIFFLHGADVFHILIRNGHNGDIVDIDFVAFYQMQKKVQGALKCRQFHGDAHVILPSDESPTALPG